MTQGSGVVAATGAEVSRLRLVALGGLGEIGRNLLAIECGDDIVVVDSGLMFPETEMLGVDLVIPDVGWLVERREKVRGIVLTHGHEDHIGALPYILPRLDVPSSGPPSPSASCATSSASTVCSPARG